MTITLQDCINYAEQNNINPKELRIWVCKSHKDKALEKTFGHLIKEIEIDLDKDLRIICR